MRQRSRTRSLLKAGAVCLACATIVYASAATARLVARKHYVFIRQYLRWTFTPAPDVSSPRHLLLVFADHFEPNRDATVTKAWLSRYAAMAMRHRDATGRRPQHTWFYPGEQFVPEILATLREGARQGLGEVEFHFHHDFDTAATLEDSLRLDLRRFAEYGFSRTADGATHFAFVHGNFGLDNSNGPFYCGVPDEIALLRQLGGFADFTFPSLYQESQPRHVNDITAIRDDSRSKSYDDPLPLASLATGAADMMMVQGPLVFAPTLNPRRLFLELDDGDIHPAMPASRQRIRRWLRANVHVPERPDWVFIKLFGHGAESAADVDAVTGPAYDDMLSTFEREYNDGRSYVLHYVTAREAYNIARAAADGLGGDPVRYRDYVIPPYVANQR